MLPGVCAVRAALHTLAEHREAAAPAPSPVSKSSPWKDEHTQEIMSSPGRNPTSQLERDLPRIRFYLRSF